jgi:hypothetical protein
MRPEAIEDLVRRIESTSPGDPAIVRDLLEALAAAPRAFGTEGASEEAAFGVACLASLEAAQEAVDRVLPNWRIQLQRADGWRCTLRESGVRDDDELIGVGAGPTPAFALLAAFLAVTARRARGYR